MTNTTDTSIASDHQIKNEFKLILKLVDGGVSSEFARGLKGSEGYHEGAKRLFTLMTAVRLNQPYPELPPIAKAEPDSEPEPEMSVQT